MAEIARLASNGTAPGRSIHFHCPGCDHPHGVGVEHANGWEWNGSLERPTFRPSILVHSHKTYDENDQIVDTPRCHSFVTDGRIQFLDDSTHALAGQTVDLPPWRF